MSTVTKESTMFHFQENNLYSIIEITKVTMLLQRADNCVEKFLQVPYKVNKND